MASSSNPPHANARLQDYQYLYASNTNASNFVSVKLSGYGNYHLWKTQMLCLMKAHEMCWLVVDDGPNGLSKKLSEKYDSLLKGWIFGSVTEEILRIVVDLRSSNDVWKKLKAHFDSTKEADTSDKVESETKIDDIDNMDSAKSEGKRDDATQTETKDSTPTEVDKKIETKAEYEETESNRALQQLMANGNHYSAYLQLRRSNELTKKINSDGNTLLHIAVGKGLNSLTEDILYFLDGDHDDLTKITNADGSTVLHIAATVGNTDAARMLVSENKDLLNTKDNEGLTPLSKAYKNMHLDTSAYLLEVTEKFRMGNVGVEADPKRKKDAGGEAKPTPHLPPVEIGINLLVHAVSAKRYDFALKLIMDNSEYATSKDDVLMSMARTFPSGLEYGETLIYPSFDKRKSHDMILKRTKRLFDVSIDISSNLKHALQSILSCKEGYQTTLLYGVMLIPFVPIAMVYWMYCLIPLIVMMVYIPFIMLYFLFWKAAAKVVPPIKNIERKKKEYEQAKVVLERLCGKVIEKWPRSTSVDLFKEPILEAAREDAYEVVEEILQKRPEAIHCEDNNGYDIIQLATIHRSERIYNMIYILGERKNLYRTMEDSYNSNMLHLVGRLAPSNKLKRITGAALQLQRELQWRQEVEKLVFPTYVNKVNIFMETPDMIFMKEHENLVKEGEQWMKNVAESCSITAALITTIVFAAAITVPGGSKETGVPVFLKEIFFTVFAVANAISLFSSTTSLLVFLSILTARCSEEDFLVRLPRQLIIGLCTLLISTTTMMVAFISTLFLVFFHHAEWMLAPICGLAFLPIAIFFIIQIPLIVDLFRSTYVPRFGKSDIKSRKFNPNVLLFFNK